MLKVQTSTILLFFAILYPVVLNIKRKLHRFCAKTDCIFSNWNSLLVSQNYPRIMSLITCWTIGWLGPVPWPSPTIILICWRFLLCDNQIHQWACSDDNDHLGICTPGLAWSSFLEIIFPFYLNLIYLYHLTNIHPITVSQLSSNEPHGFGPYVVSPDKDINLESVDQNWQVLPLSWDNLGTF